MFVERLKTVATSAKLLRGIISLKNNMLLQHRRSYMVLRRNPGISSTIKLSLLVKRKKEQKNIKFLWTNANLLGYKIYHKIKNKSKMLIRTCYNEKKRSFCFLFLMMASV